MSSGKSDHQSNANASIPAPEPTLTPAKAFPCPHCPRQFGSAGALQRHSNGHHPAYDRCPMQCRFCPFLTSKRKEFFQHRRERHPDCRTAFYCCPLCNKMYRTLGQYYDHCLVHLALNEYESGGGEDQVLASVENLEVDLREDLGDSLRDTGPVEPVDLPELTVESLVADISTNSGGIPKASGKKSTLSKSSTVKRPRSNDSSIAPVIPPSEVYAVMASPSNPPSKVYHEQTYHCPYCPERSQVPNWLHVHIYMCHGAMIPTVLKIMCGHCDLVETDSAKLRVHHQDHHVDLPMTYKCPTCGKFYRRLFFYEAHFKSHSIPQLLEKHAHPRVIEPSSTKSASQSFKCPECSATCVDLIGYETHLQEKHAEIGSDFNHSSSTLSANSTNDEPQQQHSETGQAVQQCLLCMKNFTDATKLMKHQEECLLKRGMPSAEAVPVDDDQAIPNHDDDDDVIVVKQEIDCYLTGASWYREVVIPESKVYTCAECDEKFDSLALVERHTVTEHCPANLSLLYKCTKCEATFEGFAKFQKHSLKHI